MDLQNRHYQRNPGRAYLLDQHQYHGFCSTCDGTWSVCRTFFIYTVSIMKARPASDGATTSYTYTSANTVVHFDRLHWPSVESAVNVPF